MKKIIVGGPSHTSRTLMAQPHRRPTHALLAKTAALHREPVLGGQDTSLPHLLRGGRVTGLGRGQAGGSSSS